MKQPRGFTIIQVMFLIGIIGLVLHFAISKYLDMRCKETPTEATCKSRNAKK